MHFSTRPFLAAVLAVSSFLFSCQSVSTQPRTFTPPAFHDEVRADPLDLFDTSGSHLTEAELARALDTECALPAQARIAIVHMEHDSQLSGQTVDSILSSASDAVELMLTSPSISDVAYLPQFLLPKRLTIGDLREAAARYQADATLLISTKLHLETRRHLFRDDKVFGTVVLECALIDTRTGLVLWTARVDDEVEANLEFLETSTANEVRRFERDVLEQALLVAAQRLVDFVAVSQR